MMSIAVTRTTPRPCELLGLALERAGGRCENERGERTGEPFSPTHRVEAPRDSRGSPLFLSFLLSERQKQEFDQYRSHVCTVASG